KSPAPDEPRTQTSPRTTTTPDPGGTGRPRRSSTRPDHRHRAHSEPRSPLPDPTRAALRRTRAGHAGRACETAGWGRPAPTDDPTAFATHGRSGDQIAGRRPAPPRPDLNERGGPAGG